MKIYYSSSQPALMDKLLIKFKLQNSEIQNSKFKNYDKLTGTRIKFALKVKPYNFKNKFIYLIKFLLKKIHYISIKVKSMNDRYRSRLATNPVFCGHS